MEDGTARAGGRGRGNEWGSSRGWEKMREVMETRDVAMDGGISEG